MQCSECQDLIMLLLDGKLTPQESQLLSEHLAACPDCKSEWQQLTKTVVLLRQLPMEAVPEGFAEETVRLWREQSSPIIEPQEVRRHIFRQRQSPWIGLAAACLAIFVLSGWWTVEHWPNRIIQQAASGEAATGPMEVMPFSLNMQTDGAAGDGTAQDDAAASSAGSSAGMGGAPRKDARVPGDSSQEPPSGSAGEGADASAGPDGSPSIPEERSVPEGEARLFSEDTSNRAGDGSDGGAEATGLAMEPMALREESQIGKDPLAVAMPWASLALAIASLASGVYFLLKWKSAGG